MSDDSFGYPPDADSVIHMVDKAFDLIVDASLNAVLLHASDLAMKAVEGTYSVPVRCDGDALFFVR